MDGHDFGDGNYEKIVVDLVNSGALSESALDAAVANVLRVKARLGLVNNSETTKVDETLVETNLGDNLEHRSVALRAALESVVLLNNDGGVLPLQASRLKAKGLAVIGPNADENRAGDYSAGGWAGGAPNGGGNINNLNMVTILEGLKKEFNGVDVTYALGTGIGGGDSATPFWSTIQRESCCRRHLERLAPCLANEIVTEKTTRLTQVSSAPAGHNYETGATFQPSAPSNPYLKPVPKTIELGTQGLKAEYFEGTELEGSPVISRLDYAVNFHYVRIPAKREPTLIARGCDTHTDLVSLPWGLI